MSITVKLRLLIVLLSMACARSSEVKSGAYRNVVVEIHKDVPVDDCTNFLLSLERTLKSSSEFLHSSLDGRIYYASFKIILPSTWTNDCVINGSVSNHNGSPADLAIEDTNEIFGDLPWTQQSGGCGEKGDKMFMGYKSVTSGNVSEKLVVEWMKYKYGVFDINGFENDSLYPPCGIIGGERYPICSDVLKIDGDATQFVNQNGLFSSYNRYSPSKHNNICNRRSPLDIILAHDDFKGSDASQKLADPVFSYYKRKLTRYVVIIDDHIDINVRDSFQFLRDSLRKWIEKDLSRDGTEIGIWMMSNATRFEEYETNIFKSLRASDDREELFSLLPWYIEYRSGPKCMLNLAVTRSIELLKKRALTHGDANSVILVIAPGMFKCPDDETDEITAVAEAAEIKITTINYPVIGQNRIEMDQLAYKTGGSPFTIIERKQSSDKSLLTTFFELTSTLLHISGLYYEGDSNPVPVEIYRKQLVDSGSREENKPTSDSFNVDSAIDYINFFVYIYDRRERNIEKGMRLIAPNRHEFSTSSELRAEYHQISMVGNLTGIGSWSYNIKRFYGNPQPHFVQVLAYPKRSSNDFIWTKAFVRKSRNGLYVAYAQVMKGDLPIIDASVEMTLTHNIQKLTTVKQLFDNGNGSPDISRGDGIYSRFLSLSELGMYTINIFVTDNGNTAYAKAVTSKFEGKTFHSCCGSSIPILTKQTVPPFQRYLTPINIVIKSDDPAQGLNDSLLIGRVGDLRWSQLSEESKIILEWSGPDCGRDGVKINYDVRYATHLRDLVDDFETLTNRWVINSAIPDTVGQVVSVTMNLSEEPILIGQPFYIAIKSTVEGELSGSVSNYVRVFVPKKRSPASTTFPDNFNRDRDEFDTDHSSIDSSADSNESVFQSSAKIAGVTVEVLVASILCTLAIIILISIYCWCCVKRKRTFESASKTPTKSTPKQQAISIISVPQSTPNQYNIEPMSATNGSFYYPDPSDHHTIGLPIDDDMIKPEFIIDHDRILFEEMKGNRQFQQNNSVLDSYDHEYMLQAHETLSRDGRFLSPFESWTASQLLVEHERRQSPIENDPSIMYIDSNGELVPPIPPHPYQSTYATAQDNSGRMPPPQYSSIYRPLVQIPGGSMQSVCGDKKIRNVTMV